MKDTFKTVIIMNTIRFIVFATFVTLVALHFESTRLLWWYLMIPFLGCSYEEKPIKTEKEQ